MKDIKKEGGNEEGVKRILKEVGRKGRREEGKEQEKNIHR